MSAKFSIFESDGVKTGAPIARQEWMAAFVLTQAGKDFLADSGSLEYIFEPSEDGTFHIEDVQPGYYHGMMRVQIPSRQGNSLPPVEFDFTMPAITPAMINQPLKIPDVTVNLN